MTDDGPRRGFLVYLGPVACAAAALLALLWACGFLEGDASTESVSGEESTIEEDSGTDAQEGETDVDAAKGDEAVTLEGDAGLAGDDGASEEDSADDDAADGSGEGDALSDTADGVLSLFADDAAEEVSGETFLEDIALLAEEEADGSADGVVSVFWEEDATLVELAGSVLSAYSEVDGAVLATSGYLDLQGNAWGAVVQGGESWVDIVLVTTEDDASSTAQIVRLLPDAVDDVA